MFDAKFPVPAFSRPWVPDGTSFSRTWLPDDTGQRTKLHADADANGSDAGTRRRSSHPDAATGPEGDSKCCKRLRTTERESHGTVRETWATTLHRPHVRGSEESDYVDTSHHMHDPNIHQHHIDDLRGGCWNSTHQLEQIGDS